MSHYIPTASDPERPPDQGSFIQIKYPVILLVQRFSYTDRNQNDLGGAQILGRNTIRDSQAFLFMGTSFQRIGTSLAALGSSYNDRPYVTWIAYAPSIEDVEVINTALSRIFL